MGGAAAIVAFAFLVLPGFLQAGRASVVPITVDRIFKPEATPSNGASASVDSSTLISRGVLRQRFAGSSPAGNT
jgi:hypothetical protein